MPELRREYRPWAFNFPVTFESQVTFAASTSIELGDDDLLTFGADNDIAMTDRSTSLSANTAVTGLLVGTPIAPAVAANSFILGNVTADGDILLAGQTGGNSQAVFFADLSAGTTSIMVAGVAVARFDATDVLFPDDYILTVGTGTSIAYKDDSTLANTAVTNVILGTPVTPALAADTLIVSNQIADGDLLFATQTGGNTQAAIWVDASAGETRLYGAGVNAQITSATANTSPDDILLAVGTGSTARISWDTTDANANEMLIQLPAGGGTDVPVIAIGQSIESVDLGLYNGVVDPRVALFGVGAVTTAPVLEFRKARGTIASPTVCTTGDDLGTFDFYGCVAAGEYVRSASIRSDIAGTIATTRGPGTLTFLTATDAAPSVLTAALTLGAGQTATFGAAIFPPSTDGAAIGSASVMWSDLFLADGGVINFNNGNVTLTHAAGDLTVAGATTVKLGAVTLNVTGTRIVQSYHTNLTSTNAVTVDSSIRSKVPETIHDFAKNATAILSQVRVVDYQHRPDVDPTGVTKLGVIAETVHEPLALSEIADPAGDTYPGVNLMGLQALTIKAIQELTDRLTALEARA